MKSFSLFFNTSFTSSPCPFYLYVLSLSLKRSLLISRLLALIFKVWLSCFRLAELGLGLKVSISDTTKTSYEAVNFTGGLCSPKRITASFNLFFLIDCIKANWMLDGIRYQAITVAVSKSKSYLAKQLVSRPFILKEWKAAHW